MATNSEITTYALEQESYPKTVDPTLDDILNAISIVDVQQRNSFVILSKLNKKDYVQLAGSKERLIIEYRTYTDEGVKHYTLGRPFAGSNYDDHVDYSGGPILLKQNEVMTAEEAIVIMKEFYATGQIPSGFNLRDVTQVLA